MSDLAETTFFCDDVDFIRPWAGVPTVGQEIVLGGLRYRVTAVHQYPRGEAAPWVGVYCVRSSPLQAG